MFSLDDRTIHPLPGNDVRKTLEVSMFNWKSTLQMDTQEVQISLSLV